MNSNSASHGSPVIAAFKKCLKQPRYLIVLLVLLVCAVSLNAASSALHLVFRKEALPLRSKEGLSALPARLGTWVAIPEAHTIDADMEHSLGTDKYLFRTYVDVSAIGGNIEANAAEIKALASAKPEEVNRKLNEYRQRNLNAIVRVALTYYTGKVDTVPHVPERCMVADGYQPVVWEVKNWQLGQYPQGQPRDVKVRFIDFEDQTERGALNQCVTYFFHANGHYEENPNVVRQQLQSLLVKYAYFAKIEVMTVLPTRVAGALDAETQHEKDRNAAGESVQKFLTAALPEIEKMLPDPAVFK